MAHPWRSLAKRILKILVALAAVGFAYVAYCYLSLPDVRRLTGTNPTTTAFMELRIREAADAGRSKFQIRYRWVPYSQVSANLRRAVIVTEDAAFYDHDGIDLTELKASFEKTGRKVSCCVAAAPSPSNWRRISTCRRPAIPCARWRN